MFNFEINFQKCKKTFLELSKKSIILKFSKLNAMFQASFVTYLVTVHNIAFLKIRVSENIYKYLEKQY